MFLDRFLDLGDYLGEGGRAVGVRNCSFPIHMNCLVSLRVDAVLDGCS